MARREVARLAGLWLRNGPLAGVQGPAVAGARFKSAMPEPESYDHLHEKDGKVLHPELLNEQVLKTQYAVRGELYLRAEQLRREGKEIIFTNGA